MKKLFSFWTCSAIAIAAQAQTPKIIVQGNGAPAVYTSFATAVAAATASDIVYLSGGTFDLMNTDVYIDHEVHIVGAGIHPDSAAITLPTRLTNGAVHFYLPASNCTVTGVAFPGGIRFGDFNGANAGVQGMLFTRCFFQGGIGGNSFENISVTFEQCWLQDDFSAWSIGNYASVHNSVCNGDYYCGGVIAYDHCMIFGNEIGTSGASYQDCVIARASAANVGGSAYTNCLFYNWTADNTFAGSNCVFSASNPFVNNSDIQYGYADDIHLAAGSPGIGAATDGTDTGVYGGNNPWKAGQVPYNPHYYHVSIAPATDGNGNLPVNITVARQQN